MAAGNKKKKKGVSNSARGFATTSIQSKTKLEASTEEEDVKTSATTKPPEVPQRSTRGASDGYHVSIARHDDKEISPFDYAVELETSDLQLFVEKHAAKVRRDASRAVSKLQTDKRVLRGQSEPLYVQNWLPEELMQQIIDLAIEDIRHEHEATKKGRMEMKDEWVSSIWSLRLCLKELELPEEQVNEAISAVLENNPEDGEGRGPIWGLPAALDWLALTGQADKCFTSYDTPPRREGISPKSPTTPHNINVPSMESDALGPDACSSQPLRETHSLISEGHDFDVSDVESDLEPEDLLSTYLRTKARLFEVNPLVEERCFKKQKQKFSSAVKVPDRSVATGKGEQKLVQKLRAIESDMLFDQREADAMWNTRRLELAQEAAQRRKLQLSQREAPVNTASTPGAVTRTEADSCSPHKEHKEPLARDLLDGSEDTESDDILGGMFNALPGVEDSGKATGRTGNVIIRDFGRVTGTNPKRLLEEFCTAWDSGSEVTYLQVSPTTYSCRHSVAIKWSRNQGTIDPVYLTRIAAQSSSRHLSLTMIGVAAPEVAQSEAYIATVALFVVGTEISKETQSYMRLAAAFRDLWNETSQLKKDYKDSFDRQTVKDIRDLIESRKEDREDKADDEVVFNATARRLVGSAGSSTPASRPLTPRPVNLEAVQATKNAWAQKLATPNYQRMLTARKSLPMFRAKEKAMMAVEKHQVTIVVGDTGSGKSTQLPQFILEHALSQGQQCKIYCTEPRRISAMSLARRVSEELGERKGDLGTARSLVGYAIRLESQTSAQTRLVYATVGIVLRMLEGTSGLSDVTHLILDEVHERSIDTDFLLIVLRALLDKRPDLKIVLMSATVDAQKFSTYLNGAPIIEVEGRTFPVQAKFLEDAIELTGHTNEDAPKVLEGQDTEEADIDESRQTTGADRYLATYSKRTRTMLAAYDEYCVDHVLIVKLLEMVAYRADYQAFSKAILIFLPGIAEIRRLYDMLLGHPSFRENWRVHALHSSFSGDDQQAAFEIPPPGVRKIILATNIAETGITIPDVTCVIDTGKHREMRFDERRQVSRLTQSFIAQANAKQRRGRAGRVQAGLCFHLFTRHRFEDLMIPQQTPEMLRLSLQDLVMRVKICKLGDIETALSEALDPPSGKNIRRAIDALIEVGALTTSEQLTPLGTQLAKLPLDAQLGKLILYGATFGCLDFALTVAAALSSKSPFLSPMHAKKQADSVRLGFKRGDSDPLTTYHAYCAWRKICTTSAMPEYQFCNKNFLSSQNLDNIEDLKAQLLTALVDAGFVHLTPMEKGALAKVRPGSRQRNFVTMPPRYCRGEKNDLIASTVLAWSFYPKLVKKDGKGWRNVANNQTLGLHPTSVNKWNIHPDIKYLSFYSIMQSSSRFTNAQESSAVPEFALVLLAGDAVFNTYAGVILIDGNRLRFKVNDWRTLIVLKTLRRKLKEALGKVFRHPGREIGHKQGRWMAVVESIFRGQGGDGSGSHERNDVKGQTRV